jgi:hypothetical protein
MTGNNPLLLWPILCKSSQDLGIRPMLAGALAEKNESKLSLLKHQNNLRIICLTIIQLARQSRDCGNHVVQFPLHTVDDGTCFSLKIGLRGWKFV